MQKQLSAFLDAVTMLWQKVLQRFFALPSLAQAALCAFFMTFFLFYLMSWLISGGKSLKPSDSTENFIEFVRLQRLSDLETKKRQLPKKQEVQEDLVKEKITVAQNTEPNRPDMKFDSPKLDIPLAMGAGGMGVNAGAGGAGSNADEVPLVRIEPQFPPEAAMKGINQGWVRLSFDLKPDGSVDNARVIQASPPGVFDKAALRAIVKWKYRPKVVDGKAVPRKGLKVQLDFGNE